MRSDPNTEEGKTPRPGGGAGLVQDDGSRQAGDENQFVSIEYLYGLDADGGALNVEWMLCFRVQTRKIVMVLTCSDLGNGAGSPPLTCSPMGSCIRNGAQVCNNPGVRDKLVALTTNDRPH